MGKRKKKERKVSQKKEREEALKLLRTGGAKFIYHGTNPDNFENGEDLSEEVIELLEGQE